MEQVASIPKFSKDLGRNIRVVAITGGKNVPSRRFRVEAVVPFLMKHGIRLEELCPVIGSYPPQSKLLRLPWFVSALLERLTFLYRSKDYDAVILQREMISTLPTLEWMLPKPLVLDVDDAIYLYRNGKTAKYVARSCDLVVCGNRFLAEKFSQWNSNVVVIPTGVNTDLLQPIKNRVTEETLIIGWIGTVGNYRYLKMIEPALTKVLSSFPNVRLQIISSQFPTFLEHLGEQLDFRLWQPGVENDLLPRFTVGIMPLTDNEWARGKCSFKMLQYMAAGIPIVASPVGMNADILASKPVGLAARNNAEWCDAILVLLRQRQLCIEYGLAGRKMVEEKFSLNAVSDLWAEVLSDCGLIDG